MGIYPLCEYPMYTHKIAVDITACVYAKHKNCYSCTCQRDGSRRNYESCKKCRHFKPTLKARMKAARDVLLWKNVGKYR